MTVSGQRDENRRITIVLIGDGRATTHAMALLLDHLPGFQVVGEATAVDEAIGMIAQLQPELIVTGGTVGPQVAARGDEWYRGRGRIVVITRHRDTQTIVQSLRSSIVSYLMVDELDSDGLGDALRATARGLTVLGPHVREVVRQIMLLPGTMPASHDDAAGLNGRELQVLQLLVRGATNKHIAAELGLGLRTVEGHVSRIVHKLGASSRTGAVAAALASTMFRDALKTPTENGAHHA